MNNQLIKIYFKRVSLIISFTLMSVTSSFTAFAKDDNFKAFIALEAGEKFGISRLIEDTTAEEVLEALKGSLELEGYVIEVFKPKFGIISAVKNKRTKAPKSQFIEGMKIGLFGTMASDDPELEQYSSFVTRVVGSDGNNILLQRRDLQVHWGVKGSIVNVGVEADGSNYDGVYYLLSKALNKSVEELR